MTRLDIAEILDLIGIEPTELALTHWAHIIGHLDNSTAREAVRIHQQVNTFLPSASEIVDIAADIQERDNPTPQPVRRHAVMTAYTLTGAINDPCPRCGAKPGDTCTAVTGLEAHAPCVARLIRKTVAA